MTMRNTIILTLGLLLSLGARRALAHEGAIHATGTVKEVTDKQLVISTPQGETRSFAIGPDTRFIRGNALTTAKDVHGGERAAVHARPADGGAAAYEVRLPASQAQASTPK